MRRSLYQRLRGFNAMLLLFLFSCTSVKFTSSVPGQPKPEYYSFSKVESQFSNIIDTSVIYVYANDLVRTYQTGNVEKAYTYKYLVFKRNGVVFFSNSSREPFNQANVYAIDGQYCFYKVEGDELQLELFDHNVRKFTIMHAKVLSDRVHFYKDKLRIAGGGASKQDMTFIKSSIKYSKPLTWPQ